MVKYTWFKDKVPADLKITQVYGISFTNEKESLLRIENGMYKLTGGKPDLNETPDETLIREYIEELNTTLANIYYLGYLLVETDNERYAQIRMIAKIKFIYDIQVDPATNKIYKRKLINMYDLKKYLNYSDAAGNIMIDDAIKLANDMYF